MQTIASHTQLYTQPLTAPSTHECTITLHLYLDNASTHAQRQVCPVSQLCLSLCIRPCYCIPYPLCLHVYERVNLKGRKLFQISMRVCWRQSERVVAIKQYIHEHIILAVSQTLKTDSSVLEALSQMLTQKDTQKKEQKE